MNSTGQIFILSILKTFTKKLFLTFCLLFSALRLVGQVSDDFSDNELTQNPLWIGNTDHFGVGSGTLALRAPAGGSPSYLSTTNELVRGAVWECDAQLFFNPSSSNFCRIYLISDHSNLNSDLNGYFVQIGSSTDDVSLFRQNGSDLSKIIDGRDGVLGGDQNSITIRVTRKATGEWELLTRSGASAEFQPEGTADDIAPAAASSAGIQCVFTATRADKFYFDNFVVKSLADLDPPNLSEVHVLSENEIRLVFSEPVEKSALENLLNYETTLGRPDAVSQDGSNPAVALLSFPGKFSPWTTYDLTVVNIPDISGNILARDTISFSYRPSVSSAYRDMAITELLADPSPPVGLPEAEFIELLNTTSHPIDLSGWMIGDGSSEEVVPSGEVVAAGEYVIIASAAHAAAFQSRGRVIAVSALPSLNNNGDNVILKDVDDRTIDSIRYESAWHDSADKGGGGWSLEIIDPRNPCGGEANWGSSDHPSGGTPGSLNSIYAEKPDVTGPGLLLASAVMPDTVLLTFDETLSPELVSPSSFSFSPPKEVSKVTMDETRSFIKLVVSPPLEKGELLGIRVDNVYDCAGNVIRSAGETVPVVFPEPADSLDVIVNEVLFNPLVNGVDFVEVLNRSGKYVDLSGWAIGNLEDESAGDLRPFQDEILVLAPGGYAAFTADRERILSDYPTAPAGQIFQSPTPPLNDDAGSVALVDARGKVIDAMYYSENMHSVFLRDTEGVSLERISPHESSLNPANWKSSVSQNGFATPGYQNANQLPEAGGSDDVVVEPEIFAPLSPDRNFTTISYNLRNGGFMCTISIIDAYGRCVRKVADNVLLGASGFFRWDGERDDGTKANVGNYMVRVDLFNSQGVTRIVRKRVAVAAQF